VPMDLRDDRGGDRLPPTELPISFEPPEEFLRPADEAEPANRLRRLGSTALGTVGNFFSTVGDIWQAARADHNKSQHKLTDGIASVATGGVVAIGLSRLPTVLVPKVTAEVLQHSHSALEVAAVTGAMVGAWCFTSGSTLNEGISRYPTTVKTIEEKLSLAVSSFPELSDWRAAMQASAAENAESRHRSPAGHIGNVLLTHARRGVTTVAIGVAPYVGAAHIKGTPKPAIRKLVTKSAADGGAVTGLVTGFVAEAVIKLGRSDPSLAHGIQNGLADTKLWWIAAAGLMIAESAAKIRARRKTASGAVPAGNSLDRNILGADFGELSGTGGSFARAELRLRTKLERDFNN
jgi:hypothetical protein